MSKIAISDIRKLIKADFVTRNSDGINLIIDKLEELENELNTLKNDKINLNKDVVAIIEKYTNKNNLIKKIIGRDFLLTRDNKQIKVGDIVPDSLLPDFEIYTVIWE